MKPVCLLAIVLLFTIAGCKRPHAPAKELFYIYTDHDKDGNALDSLKTYANLPFEASLELYTDVDTLNKTVEMMVHIGIFKLEGQRFAVITDTSGTAFFKFERGKYQKIFDDTPSIGFGIDPMKYGDYNKDGYTDVFYSVSSGGSYGSDDYILFFDPKKKTLIYNSKPALRNAVIKDSSVTTSGGLIWSNQYVIDGNRLWLYKEGTTIQTDSVYMREAVIIYDKKGAIVKRDTVLLPPDNW